MYLLIDESNFEEFNCKKDAIAFILKLISDGANAEDIDIYRKVTFTSEVKVISADITD